MGLRIGIDARAATEEVAGRGRVTRELLRAFAQRDDDHRYELLARERWEEPALDERFTWTLNRSGDPGWHVRAARAANRSCQVFLSTNSYLTVFFLRNVPAVPIVYDLVTFDPSLHAPRRSVLVERLTTGGAVRRSAALLAISHATAHDLLGRFPRAAGKTTVIPLAVSPALAAKDATVADLPDSFVLAVGTLEPRKNLPRLVEAFRALPDEVQAAHPLVVAGRIGWEADETLDAIRALGDRARLLGRVSDAALAHLYERCTVFCYPSLGEGFGLPVLEAMHSGAAVLTSDRSSLPEVGGDAVAYADPTSVASISDGLAQLLADPERRAALGAAARERAATFRWADSARETLAVLERVAKR